MSEKETRERAELVAALREIADLLEADSSVPTPYSVAMQAGLIDGVLESGEIRRYSQAERFAAVHRGATTLGVEVTEDEDRSRRAVRMFGPVEFKVYASSDRKPKTDPRPRIVPVDEDAALIGGGR